MLPRQAMIAAITQVFERFGFAPLQTPALEYSDILLGKLGADAEKLLFRFRDNGGRDVCLRYDLTVPLARVAAQYPDLPKPFKRYQIAPVWRARETRPRALPRVLPVRLRHRRLALAALRRRMHRAGFRGHGGARRQAPKCASTTARSWRRWARR